jgi:hypothetical protein
MRPVRVQQSPRLRYLSGCILKHEGAEGGRETYNTDSMTHTHTHKKYEILYCVP